MKKFFKLFALLVCVLSFIFICSSFTSNVKADEVTYEEADRVSITELNGSKSVSLRKNNRYTYSKTASHGSLIFTFKLENNAWDGTGNLQVYFCVDDPNYSGDYWWNSANMTWLKNDDTFMKSSESAGAYYNCEAISADDHLISIGRLAIKNGDVFTGEYYVYLEVDGVKIIEGINTYNYQHLTDVILISGNASNPNVLTDPNWVEPTYEEPDVISVGDLKKNGNKAGDVIRLKANATYTYDATAPHKSVVFKLLYEVTALNVNPNIDELSCQFHFAATWLGDKHGGIFWLRDDKNRISKAGGGYYETDAFSALGVYKVEMGKIYIETGVNAGKYRMYLSIDDEIVIDCLMPEMPEEAYVFMTGSNGNRIYDVNWEGNQVTYMSENAVYDQFVTKEDILTAPIDPVVEGKTFIGWFDKIGNKWDFANDTVAGDLTLTAGFLAGEGTGISDDYFSDENFTPVLRFIVSSDNHIGKDGARTDRLASIFETGYTYAENSTKYNQLDAALFAGDISDDGSESALRKWKNTADGAVKGNTQVIVSMGNHEYRTYDSVTHEIKVFEQVMGVKCDTHYVINGYHFIALSPNLEEGYHFSASKVAWLEEQLAAAQADDPTKPIFLIQHEGITGTVYGSISWGMDELTEVLCKYPQVVDFSGHSHYPLADDRSIWQGSFTAFGTGTSHYYELGINGYRDAGVFPTDKTGGWASSSSSTASTAEFQIVEVDANNCMRVIVYDLLRGREIRRYYLDNLMEPVKIKYSHFYRAEQSEKPYFDNVTLSAVAEENNVTVSFDQATCVDTVESYRIELYKGTKLVQTEYALSDYFFYPIPSRISISIPNLDQNTEYTIKVYAVNVWNMESDEPIQTTVTTGSLVVYEDKPQEISLNDLYTLSDNKKATTDRINSYKPVYFQVAEDNPYGSFKLKMQLFYVGGDFQCLFNGLMKSEKELEFNNNDLVWINNANDNIWFIAANYRSKEPVSYGLHTIEYGRYHLVEKYTHYTVFYVKIDEGTPNEFYHEYKSSRTFTNNGYFALNFGSTYNAGSRYYDISEIVPRTETPVFTDGIDVILSSPIPEWYEVGGALTFDSLSPTLDAWLEDSTGPVTNKTTFEGKYVLGTNGDFYHYEVKTNKFALAPGMTGNEDVIRICFDEPEWKQANLDVVIYEKETFEAYDEVHLIDLAIPDNTGLFKDATVETAYAYNGSSPTYSAVLKYYIVCHELNGSSEVRTQLGKLWSYFCTLWYQPGNHSNGFFGFNYSTRPSDKINVELQSYQIYLVETGTIRVATGEWAGWNYTYVKINNELITGFYCLTTECVSDQYQVAFKALEGYELADTSLAREIKYIVDGKEYAKKTAISGAVTYAPANPTKSGWYFTGWYTEPDGGDRIDFSKPFVSNEKTVRYYAKFSDDIRDVTFYNGGEVYEVQQVGVGGKALIPDEPTKTGEYEYSFVKWVIKGTQEEFNFDSEITDALDLEAVFEEYKYKIVYKDDGKVYATRYYLESDPNTIIGGEPSAPTYNGLNGYWVYAINTRTKGDTYAIARYNGAEISETSDIQLDKFAGSDVDIADELTRTYLSFSNTQAQAKWLSTYPTSGGHERQDLTFSWNDSSNNNTYTVMFADNEAFTDAFVVVTDKKSIDNVGIFTPGVTYYWKVVGNQTKKASKVDTFKVINTPVRWISADTVFNMRDIGGWTTSDGKQIAYGKMYRGGQLRLDQAGEASYMTEYSQKVFDYLRIKTEIELRGESKHTQNQFNEFEQMFYVNGNGYTGFFTMNDKAVATYKRMFTALANPANYPFYFHCSWGADRTGGLGFLIEAMCGVPYEQLVQDFELTSLSRSGKRDRKSTGFDAMYNQFLSDYGAETGSIQYAVTNYLKSYIGVTQAEIDAIKNILLTDASAPAVSHTVTYMIDGEEYLQSNVFDGGTISSVAPIYLEKHLDHWELNGVPFDFATPVTSDLTLSAVFVATNYEEYDVVTVRDIGLGEEWAPREMEPHNYVGHSPNGSRMLEFNYEIPADVGSFEDGVHVEVGFGNWLFKAHVWIAGSSGQHVFVNGIESPTTSPKEEFKIGETYFIQIGVLIPLDGPNAGKKMLYFIVDGEIVTELECNPDLATNRAFSLSGTQGIIHSTENKKAITFANADGSIIDTINVVRGTFATPIAAPEAPANQVFLGWYDDLGNQINFASEMILTNIKVFAKYGDRTIDALVLDENGFEIQHGYKVKLGLKASEIELPLVSDNLEFDAWYNGEVKLDADDVVTEDMNLICKFNIKSTEPVTEEHICKHVCPTCSKCTDPNCTDPKCLDKCQGHNQNNPNNPVGIGCASAITSIYASIALLALAFVLLKKKNKKEF